MVIYYYTVKIVWRLADRRGRKREKRREGKREEEDQEVPASVGYYNSTAYGATGCLHPAAVVVPAGIFRDLPTNLSAREKCHGAFVRRLEELRQKRRRCPINIILRCLLAMIETPPRLAFFLLKV